MDETRVAKRLYGIAKRWHRTFHLEQHDLMDIKHEAWIAWLQRLSIQDEEKRFQQVNSYIRRYVIKQIWGKVPEGGVIKEDRPLFFPITEFKFNSTTDYINIIMIHEAINICRKYKKTTAKHEETISWLMGYTNLDHMRGKDLGGRIKRLKNFLEGHNYK